VESVGPSLFLDGLGIVAPYQLKDAIALTMLVSGFDFSAHRASRGAPGRQKSLKGDHKKDAAGTWPLAARIKTALIAGGAAVLLSLIGMVEAFSQRFIIAEGITLGQTLLLLVGLFTSYRAAKKSPALGLWAGS